MTRIRISGMLLFAIFIAAGKLTMAQSTAGNGGTRTMIEEPTSEAEINSFKPVISKAIPWPTIWETNLLWKKRVWRTIDVKDPKNAAFAFSPVIPFEQNLAYILAEGVMNGKFKVYKDEAASFLHEIPKEEFGSIIAPGSTNVMRDFDPGKITSFQIKEDWLYLDTEQIIVVRIVGIAPVMSVANADGSMSDRVIGWLYYPYLREELAGHTVASLSAANTENWDELFETREFSSKIFKLRPEDKQWNGVRAQRQQWMKQQEHK